MKSAISFCVGRPVTIIMLITAILLGALFSIPQLPLDRLPEINYPRVTVECTYPGMGAAEVRTSLTIPLEDALSSIKGLEGMNSISRDGSSLLILHFQWGLSSRAAAALVREAIDTVYPVLPYGVSKPVIVSGDPLERAHAIVAVRSLAGDGSYARNLAEYELRSQFRRIEGAAQVTISGGEILEIHLRADLDRMAARSLSGNDLAAMVAYETGDFPAGSAREGNRELTVVSSGRPRSQEELSSLVLPHQGMPIRLDDLASIEQEYALRQSLFISDNIDQIALEIFRRPGSDPSKLSRDIEGIIQESKQHFKDIELSLVYDASPAIVGGIKNLAISGGFAALAVITILAVFLGRLRYSFLAALSLPFSASLAVIILALRGGSLNSMSLSGLALGIGLVSDTSVIVLDLLCRRWESSKEGISPKEAGDLAASVSLSSLSGSLTTMIVFLPVLFLPGPLGSLFGDLSLTLIVSVAAGWFYSQFCLPSLFCFSMGRFSSSVVLLKDTPDQGLEKLYGVKLKKILRNPIPFICLSFAASLLGLGLVYLRPMEFIAPDTVTEIEVSLEFPSGTLPHTALPYGLMVSRALSELEGIASLYGRMGAEADDSQRRGNPDYRRERLIFRCFLEKGHKADAVLDRINAALAELSPAQGAQLQFNAAYPPEPSALILGLSPALTAALKGSDPKELSEQARDLEARLRHEAGPLLQSIRLRPWGTRPQLRLLPRREIAASLGISFMDVASSIMAATQGIVTGSMELQGRPLDIRVSGNMGESDPEALRLLPLPVPSVPGAQNSGPVYLGTLAAIEWIEAETALARQDRSDVIYFDLYPAARSEKQILSLLGDMKTLGLHRADESVFHRYQNALTATVVLVLLLLYLTLGAQFESFLMPLIVMMAVPFSLAGAGLALFLTGSYLDSGAILGLVALFGIAVNGGIVLFEVSEEKMGAGSPMTMAVYRGALERFRPMLLTTLTTIFALLPLVISPLGNTQRSMASAMLGGMLVATFLVVFALPPVFLRYFAFKQKRRAKDGI
ncbi:MAG: efflux RND transporter permease subunit [Treponema sp.]|nr:efflux RND transporter permease subunit [Treponema sp.]